MTAPTRPLVIASQMDAAANARLRERLAQAPFDGAGQARVIDLEPGQIPRDLPPEVQVLIARPLPRHLHSLPPEGWPYGLRWVQLMGIGLDGYPRWLLDRVPVGVARGTSSNVIAEYVLAQVFAFAKDLPALWINEPARWKLRPTRSVAGSTLGLYGWGGIAQALARRALALGQQVRVLRRSAEPVWLDGAEQPGLTRATSLPDLLAHSDHLVLAAPATPDTREVINRDSLRHAKPGLHLINVARGSLIDQDALLQALDEGVVARASLDVTTPEPLPEGHLLYEHPRVFITPHLSSISADTEHELITLFLHNAARQARGEGLAHPLDLQRGY
ncbi:MAG: NAD(P)-dependent oxidoreductase [Comamonas sp.]